MGTLSRAECGQWRCQLTRRSISLVLARDTDYGAVAIIETSPHPAIHPRRCLPALGPTYTRLISSSISSRQYYFLYGGANDSPPLDPAQSVKPLRSAGRSPGRPDIGSWLSHSPTSPCLMFAGTSITAKDRRVFRATMNRLIRESAGSYDYLIELDKIPQLQNQNNSTYYESDAIHYKQPRVRPDRCRHQGQNPQPVKGAMATATISSGGGGESIGGGVICRYDEETQRRRRAIRDRRPQ
jgi:hypothetical protein